MRRGLNKRKYSTVQYIQIPGLTVQVIGTQDNSHREKRTNQAEMQYCIYKSQDLQVIGTQDNSHREKRTSQAEKQQIPGLTSDRVTRQ